MAGLMSPQLSRRTLLKTVGVTTLATVAGCESTPDETTTRTTQSDDGTTTTTTTVESTTYDFQVHNALTEEQFQNTEELDDPKPVEVYIRVTNLDPDSEKTYFEKTFQLATGATITIQDAFTAKSNGTIYAISAQLTPLVEGGLSRPENHEDGLTFAYENRPEDNPIEIIVSSIPRDDVEGLYPTIHFG